MFYQGRGNIYLRELDANLNPLSAKIKLCTDSFSILTAVETGTHTNKCGAVDVEDDRYIKKLSGSGSLSVATLDDKFFALGVFGTLNLATSPGVVAQEELPSAIEVGDFYFLGGKTRHRAITGLTIYDSDSPADTLVLNTAYTLDAASGRVEFLTVPATQPYTASYGYTDPQYVSMNTSAQKRWALDYEFINKRNSNDPGSLELYQVIFDPADNLDFQSDDLQVMTLKFSALADTERSADTLLGQFGRRIL